MRKVDHSFALRNYDYVLKHTNDQLKQIYLQLGPFDHYEHVSKDEDVPDSRQMRNEFFDKSRQSKYRGQVNADDEPDGMGIKLQPDQGGKFGLYEGQFSENKFNGYGRLITGNGNIYQGFFQNGDMIGEGLL